MDRRDFLVTSAATAAASALPCAAWAAPEMIAARVHAREVTAALPHIWEECVGSDRAAITLRETWRQDIELARAELGIKRVRCHGILNDELAVKAKTWMNYRGTTNFRNVAEVYDGLVSRGLSPFVELSFMPGMLASGERTFGFYKGNVTPPKSLDDWATFIKDFATFLIGRYGLNTVRQWPFEVWNEPNLIPFFTGTQADYFQLYKATAVALKSVDAGLQVGGPATSATQWVPEFLSFCASENAPLDFVSTHIYPGDQQKPIFGDAPKLGINDVVPAAVKQARARVRASAFAKLPLYMNEWSADSPALIAHVLAHVLGETEMMSHWVLSGTYEEIGPTDFWFSKGNMSWPMMMKRVPLPAYNTYRLMHALGEERLLAEGPVLASRKAGGGIAALVWNLAETAQPAGLPDSKAERKVVGGARRIVLDLPGIKPGQALRIRYVDQARGSPRPAWAAMGEPKLPTLAQFETLRRAAQIPAPEIRRLGHDGKLVIDLPPEGVALVETL